MTMANAHADNGRTGLLKLPAELRNRIYEEALRLENPYALLQTCRQVLEEVRSMSFDVSVSTPRTVWWDPIALHTQTRLSGKFPLWARSTASSRKPCLRSHGSTSRSRSSLLPLFKVSSLRSLASLTATLRDAKRYTSWSSKRFSATTRSGTLS